MAVYHALILAGMAAWNAALIPAFLRFSARYDALPEGDIPSAPGLIPYTEGAPDLEGLV